MEYTVEEKKLLDVLQRTDFAHIKKNELISYTSQLQNFSPEVSALVLDKYPQLIQLTTQMLADNEEEFQKIINSDERTISYGKELYDETLKALTDELKKDLTPEERKENREALFRLLDKWDAKDSESKSFRLKAYCMAGTFAVATVGIVASVLGGKFDFKLPNKM